MQAAGGDAARPPRHLGAPHQPRAHPDKAEGDQHPGEDHEGCAGSLGVEEAARNLDVQGCDWRRYSAHRPTWRCTLTRPGSAPAAPARGASDSARSWWSCSTTTDPSPTAEATRLTEPCADVADGEHAGHARLEDERRPLERPPPRRPARGRPGQHDSPVVALDLGRAASPYAGGRRSGRRGRRRRPLARRSRVARTSRSSRPSPPPSTTRVPWRTSMFEVAWVCCRYADMLSASGAARTSSVTCRVAAQVQGRLAGRVAAADDVDALVGQGLGLRDRTRRRRRRRRRAPRARERPCGGRRPRSPGSPLTPSRAARRQPRACGARRRS